MSAHPIFHYIQDVKERLKANETTKDFRLKVDYLEDNDVYEFSYQIHAECIVYFGFEYKGDHKKKHQFKLSVLLGNPVLDTVMEYNKEEMEFLVQHHEFPATRICTLYLAFLEVIQEAFQTHQILRLYMITHQDSFINTIETSGVADVWRRFKNGNDLERFLLHFINKNEERRFENGNDLKRFLLHLINENEERKR